MTKQTARRSTARETSEKQSTVKAPERGFLEAEGMTAWGVRDKMGVAVAAARCSLVKEGCAFPRPADVWALVCQEAGVPLVDDCVFEGLADMGGDGRTREDLMAISRCLLGSAMGAVVQSLGVGAPSTAFYCASGDGVTREPPLGVSDAKVAHELECSDRRAKASRSRNATSVTLSSLHAATLEEVGVVALGEVGAGDLGHALFLAREGREVYVHDPNKSSLQMYEVVIANQLSDAPQSRNDGWCSTWAWFELECTLMGVPGLHESLKNYFGRVYRLGYPTSLRAKVVDYTLLRQMVSAPLSVWASAMIAAMNRVEEWPLHKVCKYNGRTVAVARLGGAGMVHVVAVPPDGSPGVDVGVDKLEKSDDQFEGYREGCGLSLSILVLQLARRYTKLITHAYPTVWPSLRAYRKSPIACVERVGRFDELFTAAYEEWLCEVRDDRKCNATTSRKSSAKRVRVTDACS